MNIVYRSIRRFCNIKVTVNIVYLVTWKDVFCSLTVLSIRGHDEHTVRGYSEHSVEVYLRPSLEVEAASRVSEVMMIILHGVIVNTVYRCTYILV